MNDKCNIPHPLQREGTYRWDRMANGMKPGYYVPDDRNIEDLLSQLAEMSQAICYYDNAANEIGSWDNFFRAVYDFYGKKLKVNSVDDLMNGNTPAHLGLMIGFLKTYQQLQKLLNTYPQRHLQFYYQDVLQLKKAAAIADKVCVLLTLNKNTAPTLLAEQTLLNAGKDAIGKELLYATTRDIVINNNEVGSLRSVLCLKDANQNIQAIYKAEDVFTNNVTERNGVKGYFPFGTDANTRAEVGFAISSPVLLAKEGRRRISIGVNTNNAIPRAALKAYYTSPDGWQEVSVDQLPGDSINNTAKAKKYLLIKVYEALPAIVPYNVAIHGGKYSTTYPVVKIVLQNNSSFDEGYNFFSTLRTNDLSTITMNVEGVKNFTLSNEDGSINSLKPFTPFGAMPVKNKSHFILGCPEAFNQYLKTFHLAINWKGIPGNLISYYNSYSVWLQTAQPKTVSIDTKAFFPAQWKTFRQGNVPGKVEILKAGKWQVIREDVPNKYVKTDAAFQNTFHVNDKIKDPFVLNSSADYNGTNAYGFVKVTCQNNWGHKLYPEVASHNLMLIAKGNTTLEVPPTPYTPEFNSLHLDYVLEDSLQNNMGQHSIIQLHPFGVMEKIGAQDTLITTAYNKKGQLYIGLTGVEAPQLINLFIARQEGTENLSASIDQPLIWQYLAGNTWLNFTEQQIVLDTTLSFSASGFVSLALPKEVMQPHSIIDAEKVWIRLVSNNDVSAFPNLIAVHTNAVEAIYLDRDNDPQHLATPLPAQTIAKFIQKPVGFKSIAQPYPSYGGQSTETDVSFNTRVSERLRHKNRAWSIWDYERLVLQKFPSVYKIKAVSHATVEKMRVPGQVLVLVLPSLSQMSTQQDLLQPKLSRAVLVAIEQFLKQWMSPFAKLQCINPVYEQIRIKCSVKMNEGYDESYYAQVLNSDLQGFISPWLSNSKTSPSFEGKLYASAIINFIEERPYINYLTLFQASKLEANNWVAWNEMTTGSNEAVILTSVEQHEIDTYALC